MKFFRILYFIFVVQASEKIFGGNMTKKELMSQLENAKNNYILGLSAVSLFSNEKVYPILEESHAKFGTYTVEFKQVKKLLIKPADRDISIKEFINSQFRAFIKESFELIKNYCDESNQDHKFKAESWYQFARMIRNCLSHNFMFNFYGCEKKLLPVTWGKRTIDVSMDGKPLELKFFGYIEVWKLFMEYQNFVNNKLA